ncbi:MAG: sigma-70 family RNA polymerase sigma factor [Gemmataceae bacterium]
MTSEPSRPDFGEVVRNYWTTVYRVLHSLTGDGHTAEDLTQETFTRALARWTSFHPGSNLRAWLLRIATNACFDDRRRRKRAKVVPLSEEPAGADWHPTRRLETAERAEVVRAALATLTEQTRLVFHLRAVEGLSFREIAEVAGTTEQGARWHMHQARTKLLDILGEDF